MNLHFPSLVLNFLTVLVTIYQNLGAAHLRADMLDSTAELFSKVPRLFERISGDIILFVAKKLCSYFNFYSIYDI